MPPDPRGGFRGGNRGVNPWLVGFGILLQNIGQIVADDSANKEQKERERLELDAGDRRLLVEQGQDQQQQQQTDLSSIMRQIAASQSPDELGVVEAQTQAALPDPNDPSNTQLMDIGGTQFAGTIDTDIQGRSMATGVQNAIDEKRGGLETEQFDVEQQGFLESGQEALKRIAAGETLQDITAFQPELLGNLSSPQRTAIKGAESRRVETEGAAKAESDQDADDAAIARRAAELGIVLQEARIRAVQEDAAKADASPMENFEAFMMTAGGVATFGKKIAGKVLLAVQRGENYEVTEEDLAENDREQNVDAGRSAAIRSLLTNRVLGFMRESLDPTDVPTMEDREEAVRKAVEFYDFVTAAAQAESPDEAQVFTAEERRLLNMFDRNEDLSTLSPQELQALDAAITKRQGG